mmetsp:Transcript_106387/g.307884  ORF Transcript_106387/g.307884 Transcript_106387/m.307884 type:complete len:315 (-) Transcript_106387:832-1776(-)
MSLTTLRPGTRSPPTLTTPPCRSDLVHELGDLRREHDDGQQQASPGANDMLGAFGRQELPARRAADDRLLGEAGRADARRVDQDVLVVVVQRDHRHDLHAGGAEELQAVVAIEHHLILRVYDDRRQDLLRQIPHVLLKLEGPITEHLLVRHEVVNMHQPHALDDARLNVGVGSERDVLVSAGALALQQGLVQDGEVVGSPDCQTDEGRQVVAAPCVPHRATTLQRRLVHAVSDLRAAGVDPDPGQPRLSVDLPLGVQPLQTGDHVRPPTRRVLPSPLQVARVLQGCLQVLPREGVYRPWHLLGVHLVPLLGRRA